MKDTSMIDTYTEALAEFRDGNTDVVNEVEQTITSLRAGIAMLATKQTGGVAIDSKIRHEFVQQALVAYAHALQSLSEAVLGAGLATMEKRINQRGGGGARLIRGPQHSGRAD